VPDISMCADKYCPSRETCYRFKATPSAYQTYGAFPRKPEDVKCECHWPLQSMPPKRRATETPI